MPVLHAVSAVDQQLFSRYRHTVGEWQRANYRHSAHVHAWQPRGRCRLAGLLPLHCLLFTLWMSADRSASRPTTQDPTFGNPKEDLADSESAWNSGKPIFVV
jgi:hypothetical protein